MLQASSVLQIDNLGFEVVEGMHPDNGDLFTLIKLNGVRLGLGHTLAEAATASLLIVREAAVLNEQEALSTLLADYTYKHGLIEMGVSMSLEAGDNTWVSMVHFGDTEQPKRGGYKTLEEAVTATVSGAKWLLTNVVLPNYERKLGLMGADLKVKPVSNNNYSARRPNPLRPKQTTIATNKGKVGVICSACSKFATIYLSERYKGQSEVDSDKVKDYLQSSLAAKLTRHACEAITNPDSGCNCQSINHTR